MAKTAKKDAKKLLEEARERYAKAVEADRDNRQAALEDIRFVHEPGAQWEDVIRSERGNRPCYEFNTLRVTVKRIINDIRANRAQGKVRPTEDSDVDTAATLEGLIRNIWAVSDGDAAVDNAAEFQVAGGYGAWRIVTKYADESAWDQDICIEPLANPLCLYRDPASRDPCGKDARYWFVTSKISKEAFEEQYGDIPAVQWEENEFDDEQEWEAEDGVRIAEYWRRIPVTKRLGLTVDGQTVDLDETPLPPEAIRSQRESKSWRIEMAVISSDRVLSGPVEWAGKYFPFVIVYGEYLIIDGKLTWYGAVRHSKDPQRMHNYNMTSAAETVALAPQAKFWATPDQAVGNTEHWARAHKENLPYMIANVDPKQPGFPQWMPGAQVPAAFLGLAQISSDEIKATTGIFDASLGNRSNETAGIAIRQRQAEGAIATFNFSDNCAKGIRRTWEILVDLVPKIYDAERSVRILGPDGAEKYARINSIDPETGQVINDLSRGKYDVTVTVGPNFGTKRQEMAELLGQAVQGNPELMGVMGDLYFKTLDGPYTDEMANRMRTMLAPPVQQMLAEKERDGGKALPPEAQAAMAQANQAMQLVEQQSQLVQAAAAEVETSKADAEKAVANVQKEAAKLNADYQKMMADITRREAQLVLKEAQLISKAATDEVGASQAREEVEAEREDVTALVAQATAQLQQNVQQFLEAAAQVIVQIQQSSAEAAESVKPQPATFQVQRGPNGEIVAQIGNKVIQMRRTGNGSFAGDVTPINQDTA